MQTDYVDMPLRVRVVMWLCLFSAVVGSIGLVVVSVTQLRGDVTVDGVVNSMALLALLLWYLLRSATVAHYDAHLRARAHS